MPTIAGAGPDKETVERAVRTALRSIVGLSGKKEYLTHIVDEVTGSIGLGPFLTPLEIECGVDGTVTRARVAGRVMGFDVDVSIPRSTTTA